MLGWVNLMLSGLPVDLLPALTVYLLIGGAFTSILLRVLGVKTIVTLIYGSLFLVFTAAASIVVYIEAGKRILLYTLGGFTPLVGISYEVDLFSASIGLVVALLSLLIYPLLKYFTPGLNEYGVALYLGLIAGLLGVTYTGDVFNSFVMLEVLTISMLGLLALKGDIKAYFASLRYGLLVFVTGLVYFLGATLLYFAVGALNMGYLALWSIDPRFIIGRAEYSVLPVETAVLFPLILMTWSLIAEEALAPLHFWLPDAYSSAPPAVAGLLAGVAEAVGYYLLLRLYYTVYSNIPSEVALLLRLAGIASILVGGFGLIYSKRLLKMISYSVILDTGYIAIASSLSEAGVGVVLSYVVAHAVVKPLLFISSGWAAYTRGGDSLDELKGVFRGSRVMQLGFTTGALAVIGIPPTILFSAKLELYSVLLNYISGDLTLILSLIVALLGSGLALAGFIKAVSATILAYDSESTKPDGLIKAYTLLFTLLVLALGVAYMPLRDGFIEPASSALIHGRLNYVLEAFKAIIGGG